MRDEKAEDDEEWGGVLASVYRGYQHARASLARHAQPRRVHVRVRAGKSRPKRKRVFSPLQRVSFSECTRRSKKDKVSCTCSTVVLASTCGKGRKLKWARDNTHGTGGL